MKERLAKLQKSIPGDIGAVLITSPLNRRYFTEFPSSDGVVVVLRRKCYLLIDARYYEAAQSEVEGCEVILQEEREEQLCKLFKQHRIKKIGIESKAVTVSQLQTYKKHFKGIEIVTDDRVGSLIDAQRAVKADWELERLRQAQKIADACFLHILNYIEAGRTEREIVREMELFCLREGSDRPAFPTIVASGKHSSMPHAIPGDKQIMTGDFVTMDFGCVVDGYHSDMTRTVAIGSVSPRQKECYETVLAAQLRALEAIRSGVPCAEVDKAARDVIDASEFKGCFTHGTGHSVGLDVHEWPGCNKTSKDNLQPGMVTSVEPGIYVAGEFGVRIEDCVIVTKDGYENLCSSTKELIIL